MDSQVRGPLYVRGKRKINRLWAGLLITNPSSKDAFRVVAIWPQSGPAGIFGPSCYHSFSLAVEQVNANGGILGRPVHLTRIDGGQQPKRVANELHLLVSQGVVDAVVGMHDSMVRAATLPVTAGRIPYIYTPTYEGADDTPGLFCLGETPRQAVRGPIPWLCQERSIQKWHFIGNDYRWPRALLNEFTSTLKGIGGELVAQDLVPFDHPDFEDVIDSIIDHGAEAIFVCLVGACSVAFNRQFLARGLERRMLRFDPLIEANTKLAIGQHAESRLFAATAYHAGSKSLLNQHFRRDYDRRFGETAPEITALGAGCFDGIHFLSKLVTHAGSAELDALEEASEDFPFEGVRGAGVVRGRHLTQTVHLIGFKAGREIEFARFSAVPAMD